MSGHFMLALLEATLASSLAILVVALLRRPLRWAVGAQAAYWLWLIVPLSALAVVLPAPSQTLRLAATALPASVNTAVSSTLWTGHALDHSSAYFLAALAIWVSGAVAALALLLTRQRAFIQSLGPLASAWSDVVRSDLVVSPMLVGVWRPRIFIPASFETRYTSEQRRLILAHERAHIARHDSQVNGLAALWQCLFWFNPLTYWATSRLRFDQELACDAFVLAGSKTSRRLYADTLLKTQLASDQALRAPLGCHWESSHPLKERISMLKHPLPGFTRRVSGVALAIALSTIGSYAVWAAQPGTPIQVNMKWTINDVDVLQPSGASSIDIPAISGQEFVRTVSLVAERIDETRCRPSLPGDAKRSPIWDTAMKSGLKSTEGMIAFECKLSINGKVFSTPAIIVGDGKPGIIETADRGNQARYRVELKATMR